MAKIRWLSIMGDVVCIAAGVGSACFGLKAFLIPNHFIDGGVTGISMLVAELTHLSLAFWIAILNFPFIVLAYWQITRLFAIRSIIAILALSLALGWLPVSFVTNDKLLTAAFGGFFLGAGIGLAIRGGAVLDGTEILALILSKHVGPKVSDIILLFNLVIFSVAAWQLGIETVLYSILTYFAASRAVEFILHGIEEYVGVYIISIAHETIRNQIVEQLARGVSIFKGERGMTRNEINILFCVVSRLELGKLKKLVIDIDTKAFIIETHVSDVKGGMFKKRKHGL
jgi:uncharacterized membrane-anchored protein YitT (DUF2179 family)